VTIYSRPMRLTPADVLAGLPENLSREEARAWLRAANELLEASVGVVATPEQMRRFTSAQWQALKRDPHALSEAVRAAHVRFRERFDRPPL